MSALRTRYSSPAHANPIGQRLRLEMRVRGVTSAELAKRADVKTSFIYDVISGKSANPSTVKLARVAEGLGITLANLVESLPSVEAVFSPRRYDDYIPIAFLSAGESLAAAPDRARNPDPPPYCFHASWIKERLGASAADLRLFIINGDSMEPTLCHNDAVLVDISNTTPTPPGIFVLSDGYGLVAKRVERVMSLSPPRLRIIPDNPQYAIYERSPSETTIIGRVVWCARAM